MEAIVVHIYHPELERTMYCGVVESEDRRQPARSLAYTLSDLYLAYLLRPLLCDDCMDVILS